MSDPISFADLTGTVIVASERVATAAASWLKADDVITVAGYRRKDPPIKVSVLATTPLGHRRTEIVTAWIDDRPDIPLRLIGPSDEHFPLISAMRKQSVTCMICDTKRNVVVDVTRSARIDVWVCDQHNPMSDDGRSTVELVTGPSRHSGARHGEGKL